MIRWCILIHRIKIHRVILAAISVYFANVFETVFYDAKCDNDIVLVDLEGKLLNDLVAYFYTGNIDINTANAKKLMDFAVKFEIELLLEKCAEFKISIGFCIEMFIFADRNDNRRMRENALWAICMQFNKWPSHEIQLLDVNIFMEMIKFDRVLASEEFIFDRLVEWVRFDECNRSKYIADLLKCIQLKHIPTKVKTQKIYF